MPKLNTDQRIGRLERRITELEAGEEVAIKHIRALLTEAQQQALDDALAAQVELKKAKRARTEEEKQAFGWKTIREVRLDILRNALTEANADLLADFKRRQDAALIRQTRIYFDSINKALKDGKDLQSARIWANNELTRAGLPRMDGLTVECENARDKQVAEMEDALRARFRSEMTADEREQLEMVEELERRRMGKDKGAGKAK